MAFLFDNIINYRQIIGVLGLVCDLAMRPAYSDEIN